MNYIRHLTGFFELISTDERLNPAHVSVYMALFQFWNINRFRNPISINRSEMMSISKISAKATYHKVIKNLHSFGYIRYEPSYNPFKGSKVYLTDFSREPVQNMNNALATNQSGDDQVQAAHHTKNQSGVEQALVPSINSINITNNKHSNEHATENTSSNNSRADDEKKKSCAKRKSPKENLHEEGALLSMPTTLADAKAYFQQQDNTEIEAEKFFNYYQSNGWRIGGRTPMKDWRAAARNWMLNSYRYPQQKQASKVTLAFNGRKDYSEPL